MNWISIKDRLPSQQGEYLVCFRDNNEGAPNYEVASFHPNAEPWSERSKKNIGWGWANEMIEPYQVNITHWCEIEEPEDKHG